VEFDCGSRQLPRVHGTSVLRLRRVVAPREGEHAIGLSRHQLVARMKAAAVEAELGTEGASEGDFVQRIAA
jgi:hypothetical protein